MPANMALRCSHHTCPDHLHSLLLCSFPFLPCLRLESSNTDTEMETCVQGIYGEALPEKHGWRERETEEAAGHIRQSHRKKPLLNATKALEGTAHSRDAPLHSRPRRGEHWYSHVPSSMGKDLWDWSSGNLTSLLCFLTQTHLRNRKPCF